MDTESLKTESESKTTENLRLSPVIGTSQFSKRKVKLRKSHSFKDNNTETTTVFADIDVEKSTKSETSSTSTNNSFQEKNCSSINVLNRIKHLESICLYRSELSNRIKTTPSENCTIPSHSQKTKDEKIEEVPVQPHINFESVSVNSTLVNQGNDQTSSVLKSENSQNRLTYPESSFQDSISMNLKNRKVQDIFKGENFDDLRWNSTTSFRSASSNVTSVRNELNKKLGAKKSFKNIFEGEDFSDLDLNGIHGFQKCAFKHITNVPKKDKIPPKEETSFKGFSIDEQQLSLKIAKTQNDLHDGDMKGPELADKTSFITRTIGNNRKRTNSKAELDQESSMNNSSSFLVQISTFNKPKKPRLGCHFSPTIQVSTSGLNRSKMLFADLFPEQPHTSTPLKMDSKSISKRSELDLTPIKCITNLNSNFSNSELGVSSLDCTFKNSSSVTLSEPTKGNVTIWLKNLEIEKEQLEEKLKLVTEKCSILSSHCSIITESERKSVKLMPGVLYNRKNLSPRVPLKNLVNYCNNSCNSEPFLNEVTPQNALMVHFNSPSGKSHFITMDGATVVPNSNEQIGVSEIDHSFKTTKGVTSNLLPQGWVKNHYKWIIWKLVSYERRFKDALEECLSIENVLQQLKYRYDIEVGDGKRSCIRRIFEKDDTPQRRMVLCVARIIKQTNNWYDLELTDGWYSVRTTIDAPLNKLIIKNKIKCGDKLIIFGAELSNLEDACHPLEATEGACLKICYNSTRRAAWWVKLGYQKASGPYLVPMSSIKVNGGKIGSFQCFIARVYPVKFMEKIEQYTVWRNEKAKERREQEVFNMKEKVKDRTVSSILKLKVIDCYGSSKKFYLFHIWNPTEDHLFELKENRVITVFNAISSWKWGMISQQCTHFRIENKTSVDRFAKFKRKITNIKDIFGQVRLGFNEFDTVGLVVVKEICENSQNVWLTDHTASLLHIVIDDSPKNILALDMINEGQIVSVCNVTFRTAFKSHTQVNGDHSIVFARYSQYIHLREAIEILENDLSKMDKHDLIQQCKHRIRQISDSNESCCEFDDMEVSQITPTDMLLLKCIENIS
ncbi:hypothetical protein ABEB36_000441 [Hypothenemus hampei]|uniref:Uncharacterized protein n=1 Tax=Hypothenemus hampei TaxID=57062 RepID=A0ABD1FDU2_HYPHA